MEYCDSKSSANYIFLMYVSSFFIWYNIFRRLVDLWPEFAMGFVPHTNTNAFHWLRDFLLVGHLRAQDAVKR